LRGEGVNARLMNTSDVDPGLRRSKAAASNPSFPDVQLHIVDAPLGAGPESILPAVVMDSGLALRAPRNDGLYILGCLPTSEIIGILPAKSETPPQA